MTTLGIDTDFDFGRIHGQEHRLGEGWDLEQRRCLEILGDEFGRGGRRSDKPYEPMFDDAGLLGFGARKSA